MIGIFITAEAFIDLWGTLPQKIKNFSIFDFSQISHMLSTLKQRN